MIQAICEKLELKTRINQRKTRFYHSSQLSLQRPLAQMYFIWVLHVAWILS